MLSAAVGLCGRICGFAVGGASAPGQQTQRTRHRGCQSQQRAGAALIPAQKPVQLHTVRSAQRLIYAYTLCTDYAHVEVSWQGAQPLDRSTMSRRIADGVCVM